MYLIKAETNHIPVYLAFYISNSINNNHKELDKILLI